MAKPSRIEEGGGRFCSKGCATIVNNKSRQTVLTERFCANVDKNGPVIRAELGNCWIWTGYTNANGYGTIQIDGRPCLTHRVSWELANGPITDGLWILHQCDNPPCVRVDHFLLGTVIRNVQDAVDRNRLAQGDRNGNAKLLAENVAEIRTCYQAGEPAVALAARFGISRSTVHRVVGMKAWAGDS
jgi:hypothetical protein